MDIIFTFLNGYEAADRGEELFYLISREQRTEDTELRRIQWARFYAKKAVATLGAFLREEKLPNPGRLERLAALGER